MPDDSRYGLDERLQSRRQRLLVAVVMGFQSGLLRSLATILGYVCAAPVAIAAAPALSHALATQLSGAPPDWMVFAGVLITAGIVLAALMRERPRSVIAAGERHQIGYRRGRAGRRLARLARRILRRRSRHTRLMGHNPAHSSR